MPFPGCSASLFGGLADHIRCDIPGPLAPVGLGILDRGGNLPFDGMDDSGREGNVVDFVQPGFSDHAFFVGVCLDQSDQADRVVGLFPDPEHVLDIHPLEVKVHHQERGPGGWQDIRQLLDVKGAYR